MRTGGLFSVVWGDAPRVSEGAGRARRSVGEPLRRRTTGRGQDRRRPVGAKGPVVLQGNEEGWPLEPGDLGENMTTKGMVNVDFDVGVRLRLGDVLAEVAENDMPCKILGQLPYIGEEQCAEFIKTLVGRRGWYAKVVEEGVVSVADQVGVE